MFARCSLVALLHKTVRLLIGVCFNGSRVMTHESHRFAEVC